MERIHDTAGLPVAFPPAEADEKLKNAAASKFKLFQPTDAAPPVVQALRYELRPLDVAPAPGSFVSLASLGLASAPAAPAGPAGHIPEHGPTGNSMPFYDQGDSQGCGTTSLSMILKYFGIDISREAIDSVIRRTDSSAGSNPGDLIEFARDHGLEAEGYNNASWEDVKSMIDQGYPVMASIGNGDGGRHLIVITGYQTGADGKTRVLYHDPEHGDENGVPCPSTTSSRNGAKAPSA